MTKEEADRLTEGDRVKSRALRGTVVGTTPNCISILWNGRATPEIYIADDMRHIRRDEEPKPALVKHSV
jgi:hypothetical protein